MSIFKVLKSSEESPSVLRDMPKIMGIDELRDLIALYDNELISLSKVLEEINYRAFLTAH